VEALVLLLERSNLLEVGLSLLEQLFFSVLEFFLGFEEVHLGLRVVDALSLILFLLEVDLGFDLVQFHLHEGQLVLHLDCRALHQTHFAVGELYLAGRKAVVGVLEPSGLFVDVVVIGFVVIAVMVGSGGSAICHAFVHVLVLVHCDRVVDESDGAQPHSTV
jgi:hypothetical protein